MKPLLLAVAALALPCLALPAEKDRESSPTMDWPPITKESRPWTRWWWLGSAVSEAEITRHLQLFQEAGIGGVEITPIYGATGDGEAEKYIPYLSPRWVELLGHALREARQRDMGVDMITGTGWPFGGPWVPTGDAAARFLFESFTPGAAIRSAAKPEARLLTLMAYGPDAETVEVTDRVDASGTLDWAAPGGPWTLHAIFLTGTGQQVKRAAPGGEGNVLDHFSGEATRRYLAHFDTPLSRLPDGERLRGLFNDSYEVYGANGTPGLLDAFARRRGYDLRGHLPALSGQGDPDTVRRVRSDYRQTVGDLLLEDFTRPWAAWARGKGALARNQAHGSPGNLLDLYAAVDIPETEVFGPAALDLVGLKPLPGTPDRGKATEEILVCKMASSAAHVAGKPLVSSESFTWLGEHGKVPLEHIKAETDLLFALGINHLFFHGTPFSPAEAAWPGWLFYATTHVAPTNPFWRDLPALNGYIARCQSFLQAGQPDNDVLLYFPYYDLLGKNPGSKDVLQFLTVGNTERWLTESLPAFTQSARHLWERGYGFDFVSDQQLETALRVSGSDLQAKGGTYRTLVVAGCAVMPPETLERIVQLARDGATVLVVGDLPTDVPGLGALENRRRRLRAAASPLDTRQEGEPGVSRAGVGRGQMLFGSDLERLLAAARVRRETVVDAGVAFIRRRGGAGERHYFLTNLGQRRLDGWVSLAVPARAAVLFDPMHARRGKASVRQGDGGDAQVYLQLEPGESLLLRALPQAVEGPEWEYLSTAGEPTTLTGDWHVTFTEGGPALPRPATLVSLTSWTAWPGDADALRAFSGTARYTLTFDRPAGAADAWLLDLGRVFHSARVRLNGEDRGTLYAHPFRLRLPDTLQATGNRLEIEVTNLMANRLADLDRRKVAWRNFFFVNIEYKPFDASAWEPLDSGLLGPVRLIPVGRRNNL